MTKNAIIYCRISMLNRSPNANKYLSLHVQERLCHKFATANKLVVKQVCKETHSAYNKIPRLLRDIFEIKNHIIIFGTVDRFSRSVKLGKLLMEKAIANKNKLAFVNEKIMVSNIGDIDQILSKIQVAQDESQLIGERIKRSKTFMTVNKLYSGGIVPYGFYINNSKYMIHINETKIVDFIKLCKSTLITTTAINSIMLSILTNPIPPENYEPVVLYNNNVQVDSITEPLRDVEIVHLLNSYYINKRNITWKPSMIKRTILSYNKTHQLIDIPSVSEESIIPVVNVVPPQSTNISFVNDIIPELNNIIVDSKDIESQTTMFGHFRRFQDYIRSSI